MVDIIRLDGQVPFHSLPTYLLEVSMVLLIAIIRIMLSDQLGPKVISLSSAYCINYFIFFDLRPDVKCKTMYCVNFQQIYQFLNSFFLDFTSVYQFLLDFTGLSQFYLILLVLISFYLILLVFTSFTSNVAPFYMSVLPCCNVKDFTLSQVME